MEPVKTPNKLHQFFSDKNLSRLAWVIIALGILLRVALYLQNRCLIIDEANVARNLYERGFMALTQPLSYDQFAPPVFLWISKCFSTLFGFSEYALRLYPLLCGILSLFLFHKALKQYAGASGIWYSLMIFATGIIYIRYSSELKQYMGDVVVVLCLLLLALRSDIQATTKGKFFLLWFLVGSAAIWLSMPSVFMLAGVWLYYVYLCIKAKEYNKLVMLAGIGLTWLAQFAIYYFAILRSQINSDLLQTFHQYNFLFKFPDSKYKLDRNLDVLTNVLSNMGGKWAISLGWHILLLFAGGIWLVRKQTARSILLLVPVMALYIAAATHQYALTPRIILFIMPVLLIFIATGLWRLFQVRYQPLRCLVVVPAIVCIVNFGAFRLLYKPLELEELTKSMAYIQQEKVTGEHLYVHCAAVPAYIYYTTINPQKDRWKDLANGHLLNWNSNYDSLGHTFTGRSAVLRNWWPEDQITAERNALKNSRKEVDSFRMEQTSAFIYE